MSDSVLIVSDQGDFARAIVARWRRERSVPAFTLIGTEFFHADGEMSCQLALVAPPAGQDATPIAAALGDSGVPVLYLASSATEQNAVRLRLPRAVVVVAGDEDVDAVVTVALEMLKNAVLARKLRHAEAAQTAAEAHATLGHYMIEHRHSLNNALTSLLGNAELLLLDPGSLGGEQREQLETMHSMALRIHELMSRFTSLETELRFAAQDSQAETLSECADA